jgi:putative hydrolase of the HAD superfamily
MTTRAVVFDLFDTLVDYDDSISRQFSGAAAELLGREPGEFHELWRAGRAIRDRGPLMPYLASIGVEGELADRLLDLRHDSALRLLGHPRAGAVETLRELRARGVRTGLITVCSEDTPEVWARTPFAGLFDAEVFSCSTGLCKPDPRIYALALEQLGVEPGEALFVGDGANDELAGAERVGMRAVLIHRPGAEPPWPEAQAWSGLRITAVPQVLEHL